MGNIRRKKTFERLVATGKIEGKRSRGRGQIKLTDSLWTCAEEEQQDCYEQQMTVVWTALITNTCHLSWTVVQIIIPLPNVILISQRPS